MQAKALVRYHSTPIKMARTLTKPNAGEAVGILIHC